MRSLLCFVLAALSACVAAPPGAPAVPVGDVVESLEPPPGYVAGEALRVSCHRTARTAAFRDLELGDIDCNFERLSRLLRARAGERASRFVIAKHCESRPGRQARLECSGRMARLAAAPSVAARSELERGPAPSPAQVRDLDEPRPQDAGRIRVSFTPVQPGREPTLPARAYDRVAETQSGSVGRPELGKVSARCEDACSDDALRYALRVAAGRAGAGEVTCVNCIRDARGARCVATALVPWSF